MIGDHLGLHQQDFWCTTAEWSCSVLIRSALFRVMALCAKDESIECDMTDTEMDNTRCSVTPPEHSDIA